MLAVLPFLVFGQLLWMKLVKDKDAFLDELAVPGAHTLGGGKGTVVSLLERFYDPMCGEILLDIKPIKDLNLNYCGAKSIWSVQSLRWCSSV